MANLKTLLANDSYGNLLGMTDSLALSKVDIGAPVVVSTDVFMDIEADGGGDIVFSIAGTAYTLDCTTGDGVGGKARVTLIQPVNNEEPTWQFIYAAYSEQDDAIVLFASEVIPTGHGFVSIAYVVLQDYVETAANPPPVWHRTTDMASWGERSATSYTREKIRLALHNNRITGCEVVLDITPNGSVRDNIDVISSPGTLYQLHRHDWPGKTASVDGIRIIGQTPGATTIDNYDFITDLGTITETREGETIVDGDTIAIDFVAVINSSGQEYLAAMIGFDVSTDAASVVHDAKHLTGQRYPKDLDQVTATLGRAVLTYASASGGTWTNAFSPATTTWQWQTNWISDTTPNYPSNYTNNLDQYWGSTYTVTGATMVRAHFSAFNTESGYDYIRMKNVGGTTMREYHGNLGSFITGSMTGPTIRFYIDTDGSVTRPGCKIDYVQHWVEVTTGGISGYVWDLR